MLCLLDAPGGLAPGWAVAEPDDRITGEPSAEVGPMLALEWQYETRRGFRRFEPAAIDDGTGGLRRSGVVCVTVPPDWAPMDTRAAGPWPFRVRVATRMAPGVVPPLIRGLIPNVVVAAHRWTGTTRTRMQRAPLPGARIDLALDGAPMLVDETRLTLAERDGAHHAWSPTDTFALHGPSDRVFTVDAERGRLAFGDGRTGRQPVTPAAGGEVEIDYTLGGGPGGDIAPGLAWTGVDRPEVTVINVVAGTGGRAAETLAAAEQRAGALIDRPERALAIGDMVHLARTTPGVAIARAHAIVGHDPRRVGIGQVPGVVTVFVVPAAHPAPSGDEIDDDGRVDAPVPDPAALRAVTGRLASRRPVGIELHVRPPCYRRVELRCHANGDLVHRDRVFAALLAGLRRFLDPLDGGEVGGGWPFGGPLIPSALLGVARLATEDIARVDAIEIRLAGEDAWQGCEPAPLRPHELPCLTRLVLVYAPRRHAIGGLR